MASGSSVSLITASAALEYFHRELQTGILRGAGVLVQAGNPNPTDTWIILFISDSGDNLQNAVRILQTGYITIDQPTHWSGEHIIEGHERVVVGARSSIGITLKVIVSVDITTEIPKRTVGA